MTQSQPTAMSVTSLTQLISTHCAGQAATVVGGGGVWGGGFSRCPCLPQTHNSNITRLGRDPVLIKLKHRHCKVHATITNDDKTHKILGKLSSAAPFVTSLRDVRTRSRDSDVKPYARNGTIRQSCTIKMFY